MDEIVHVKLEGTMAELMARMDPKMYRKYVQYEHSKPVLYVELLKALYGTLRASLLFWKKLSKQLIGWVLEESKYHGANERPGKPLRTKSTRTNTSSSTECDQ